MASAAATTIDQSLRLESISTDLANTTQVIELVEA